MLDHGLAGGFVDSPGAAAVVLAAAGAWACGAAALSSLPSPQPARAMAMASRLAEARGIRIMVSCVVWLDRAAWHAKLQHHAKDLHLL
jgi:hypothetical protein